MALLSGKRDDLCRPRDREFVHSPLKNRIVTVDHHALFNTDRLKHIRNQRHQPRRINPAHHAVRARWIGKRGRNVQGRTKTDLAKDTAKGAGMDLRTHPVKEAKSARPNALLNCSNRHLHANTRSFQHVHGPARGGQGSRPMACERSSAGRSNNRCNRADIEGLQRIHARTRIFNERTWKSLRGIHSVELHDRPPRAFNLADSLPFGDQRSKKSPLLQIRLFAFQNFTEGEIRLFRREVRLLNQTLNQLTKRNERVHGVKSTFMPALVRTRSRASVSSVRSRR